MKTIAVLLLIAACTTEGPPPADPHEEMACDNTGVPDGFGPVSCEAACTDVATATGSGSAYGCDAVVLEQGAAKQVRCPLDGIRTFGSFDGCCLRTVSDNTMRFAECR